MAFSKPQSAIFATKLLIASIISAVLYLGLAAYAEAQEASQNSSGGSWTATTEGSTMNVTPWRTTQSHTKSGNRTLDKQLVEVLGPDGQFRPETETETETIRLDDTTTRTVVRAYKWDGNGRRILASITEEEARHTASGDSHVVSTTSNADVNGNFQTVKREVTDTNTTIPKTWETKTKVYLGDGNGGFVLAVQALQLQKRDDDDTIEVMKKTLLPDGNGNWKVDELSEKRVKGNDRNRTTQERITRPDTEGRLSEILLTVGDEAKDAEGDRNITIDKYSRDVPGATSDGSMHWTQRDTTIQKNCSGGEKTEQQVEQPDPGNPSDGPQVIAKTRYTVQYTASGSKEEKTTQVPDGNGAFKVFYLETRKSERVSPAQ
jgi:hypothetical protein